VHPSQIDLKLYLENRIQDTDKSEEISAHLKRCQFCREYCDNYGQLTKHINQAKNENIPAETWELANRLFNASMSCNIIYLKPLEPEPSDEYLQAADGIGEPAPDIENIATLYSEQPEMVLQLMRDNKQKLEYFQLIAEDDKLISHVLVQIPEKNEEFITDINGRAELKTTLINPSTLNWQIKMPDAQFSLKPLKYDPEKIEYQNELELETDRNDKIRVTFMGKTKGKQISIQILALEGKKDFGDMKVMVNQKNKSDIQKIEPEKSISFNLGEGDDEISIRLFQL